MKPERGTIEKLATRVAAHPQEAQEMEILYKDRYVVVSVWWIPTNLSHPYTCECGGTTSPGKTLEEAVRSAVNLEGASERQKREQQREQRGRAG